MGNTIGLTGSSGAIGSYLGAYLEKRQIKVMSLDPWTRGAQRLATPSIEEPMEWVIHMAAHTTIEESWKDPFKYFTGNSNATLSALEAAHVSKAKFIYISSYVYGSPQYLPIDEEHPVAPTNPYMESKLISERICAEVSNQLNLTLTIFRPFHIYGPGGRPGRLITDLLSQAIQGEALTLNDPEPRRDYLFVEDFCELVWLAINKPTFSTGIFNVGSGESYSNMEVAEAIRELVDPDLKIVTRNYPRHEDVGDCSMTPHKVREAFGWRSNYSLRQGLRSILAASSEIQN